MKKLYFVVTNGYNMCVSDDGEVRRVISNECVPQGSSITEAEAIEWLNTVEDDSSWECYEEPIDEFTRVFDNEVVASIESDI